MGVRRCHGFVVFTRVINEKGPKSGRISSGYRDRCFATGPQMFDKPTPVLPHRAERKIAYGVPHRKCVCACAAATTEKGKLQQKLEKIILRRLTVN